MAARIAIVSDNQQHNLFGAILASFAASTREAITPVARRPPLLNLMGSALLAQMVAALTKDPETSLVLHLGDAADTPCTGEYDEFLEAMHDAIGSRSIPWIAAPGNHDAFLAGNTQYRPAEGGWWGQPEAPGNGQPSFIPSHNSWNQACWDPVRSASQPPSVPMNKQLYVCRYLDEVLGKPPETTCSAVRNCSGETCETAPLPKCTSVHEARKMGQWAYEVSAEICPIGSKRDPGPWKAWIVQQVSRSGLRIVVLDTTDTPYSSLSHLISTHGAIGEKQRAIVSEWIDKGNAGDTVVFAGHHPLSQLPPDAQTWIAALSDVYLSAHTHLPNGLFMHPVLSSSRLFPEINVASVLDWPMEALDLRIRSVPRANAAVLDWTTYAYSFSQDGQALPWAKDRKPIDDKRPSPAVPETLVEEYEGFASTAARLHVPNVEPRRWSLPDWASDLWSGCSACARRSLLAPVRCAGGRRRPLTDYRSEWLMEAVADSKSVKDDQSYVDRRTERPVSDPEFNTSWLDLRR